MKNYTLNSLRLMLAGDESQRHADASGAEMILLENNEAPATHRGGSLAFNTAVS